MSVIWQIINSKGRVRMGRTSNASIARWKDKTYKSTEVLMSINDRDIIKQWCRQHGYTMSGYIYELVIKDMAARGIRLEGTATRNVDDIINNDALSTANRTSAPDEDCDK